MTQIKIKALYRSRGHSYKGRHGLGSVVQEMEACERFDLVAGAGIVGDRYFNHKPDFKGQITFFDWAVYQEVMEHFRLPSLAPSAFRRNALIAGIDLNSLIGKTFTIGGVTYSGSEEAAPCYWMNEACADGVHKFLKGKGGLRCRVKSAGPLFLGTQDLSLLPASA